MNSSRPYLVRAIYEWINDNLKTPYILVNTRFLGVSVPKGFAKEDRIVLNLAPSAIERLFLDNDKIEFVARFKGVRHDVVVPIMAVLGIYAKENGQGMVFDEYHEQLSHDEEEPPRPKGPPTLRVVH